VKQQVSSDYRPDDGHSARADSDMPPLALDYRAAPPPKRKFRWSDLDWLPFVVVAIIVAALIAWAFVQCLGGLRPPVTGSPR